MLWLAGKSGLPICFDHANRLKITLHYKFEAGNQPDLGHIPYQAFKSPGWGKVSCFRDPIYVHQYDNIIQSENKTLERSPK